jgi:hypothetical protein
MQLYNFIIQLINYYPPEYVSLYLLMGLGIVWARLAKSSIVNLKDISPLGLIIGIPFGVMIGIILGVLNIALWPSLLVGIVYHKISK